MSQPLGAALVRSLIAASVLSLASTLGDWIWAHFVPDGAIVPAIVHGVVIFALLAWVLGSAAGAPGTSLRLLATATQPSSSSG